MSQYVLTPKRLSILRKMSDRNRGRKPVNFEYMQKLAWQANRGRPAWNKGKVGMKFPNRKSSPHSEEHNRAIAEAMKRIGAGKWMIGRKLSEEHRRNIGKGLKGKTLGKKLTPEHLQRLVASHTGKKLSPHHREVAIKNLKRVRGEAHPWWKGGVTGENKMARRTVEYKLWRKAVFERDNYTCLWCGVRGGELCPDHIKPFAYYPELRTDINNGRTLCYSCHKKTDTYGGKAINYQK